MMPKNRNKNKKQLLPVLHIYCEGEKTEPNYLNGYINKKYSDNRRLRVVKVEKTNKNTPKQLIEVAVAAKENQNTPEGDKFWVVYDREGKHKYSDKDHETAYQNAKKHNIDIALSNVCFEVWLLLHFQNTVTVYSCYDDLRKNSNLRAECKKVGINDYDKADKKIFDAISENIKTASERAEKMNETTKNSANSSCTKPYQLNPYTDVHKLLEAIDKFWKDTGKSSS